MRYHFIAIGGAAMHNLAIALKQAGHQVTGSDDEIFEPSLSRLQRFALLPSDSGWFPEKIHQDLDAVILGMHARKDNPELIRANELGIPVFSFPEFLYEQYKRKTRVVIAGSHGKTTITSMILHAMRKLGHDPDYMVGAQLEGFDVMVKITPDEGVAVLEGDEYLTSPIDRRPKFLHYKPDIALISGIAWDHMNVFPTFQAYVEQFALLIRSLPPGGTLIYCDNDEVLKELVLKEVPSNVHCIPYRVPTYHLENGIAYLDQENQSIPLQVFGRHNLMNLMGAASVCMHLGLSQVEVFSAMSSFPGASRRLEKLLELPNAVVFRDFAHAPSKVKATVEAVREQYPDSKVIACLELHTFSSLSADFLPLYAHSMQDADKAIVFYHPETLVKKKLAPLSEHDVKTAFYRQDMLVFHDPGQLEQFLLGLQPEGFVLLLMSSGDFHGLNINVLLDRYHHLNEI